MDRPSIKELVAFQKERSHDHIEVCFDGGGRVGVCAIPHGRPEPPEAPPIGCIGCRRRINGGEGFFVEIDSGRGWGVGRQVICGPCMAQALRPSNVIRANEGRG